jgi:hypothetical protein
MQIFHDKKIQYMRYYYQVLYANVIGKMSGFNEVVSNSNSCFLCALKFRQTRSCLRPSIPAFHGIVTIINNIKTKATISQCAIMSEFVNTFPPPPRYYKQFADPSFTMIPPAVIELENNEIYGGSMLLPAESGNETYNPDCDYRIELKR